MFQVFFDLPYNKYRGHPHWVPPLRMSERGLLNTRKNPFFEHATMQLFVAYEDGRVQGRIAAIDDRLHNETHPDNLASFGFFEANTEEAARALLGRVEAWARERGRQRVRGPVNPSLNDSAGMLVDAYQSDPQLMMPYNPPEYPGFVEAAGYRKIKDLWAWYLDLTAEGTEMTDNLLALSGRIKQRYGIHIRSIDMSRFNEELKILWEIYCAAWKHNWGFVPPTDREFSHTAAELKQIVDPEFVLCVEIGGAPAACAVAVPDINQVLKGTDGKLFPLGLIRLLRRKAIIDRGRLLLLGVRPQFRHMGVYPLLLTELYRRAKRRHYRSVECSWVLEDNADINQPAAASGMLRHYKTYRLYQKEL